MTHIKDLTRSERAVIGAILGGDLRATDSGLKAAAFSVPLCAQVFALALQLEAQGRTADLVTVCDVRDDLDAGALIDMQGAASVERSIIATHVGNVRDAALRRQLTKLCAKCTETALNMDEPVEDTLSRMRVAVDRLSTGSGKGGYVTATDAMLELWALLEGKKQAPALSTGLTRLDAYLNGGLRGGKMITIGARPAVGKSALMLYIASKAILNGSRVLICSLEMSEVECVQRMLALIAGVDASRLEGRSLTDDDWGRMAEGTALIPGDNIRFTKNARTPEAVRTEALRMRADCGLDLVVVDYLQLMSTSGKVSGRVEAVGEISRNLKLLALELGIPVICGAQVNRQSAQGGEERPPKLSELRESGSIEQDSDIVFMLHASQLGKPERELIVAKNRQGRTGRMNLLFEGARMRFTEVG